LSFTQTRTSSERRDRVGIAPTLYSGGPGFKYRPLCPACLTEVLRGTFCSSSKFCGSTL